MTTTSLLFVATRWTMLANALLQFAPTTESTFDSILSSHLSDTNILPSNCEALIWSSEILFFAEFIGTACKHTHSAAMSCNVCSQQYLVFSAIRVFAIWQRSYSWACVVFLLGIVPAATNLVSFPGVVMLMSSAYCLLRIATFS